jgi:hypothetical protein|tara:strand:+ start:3953 stop:4588 length:636 start_codon:yes stop_codon:yes gene_type:complete
MTRTILSLCDFTGSWARPYAEAGYRVVLVDIKPPERPEWLPVEHWLTGRDVHRLQMDLHDFDPIRDVHHVHGVMIAPPCENFSGSGAQYWPAKDADGRTDASVSLVYKARAIVKQLEPKWWCLENTVGRLKRFIGDPVMRFDPCDYGDAYTKRTCLWGEFNMELELDPVVPERTTKQGSWVQKLGGKSDKTKTLRSVTPQGFARAFRTANP